MSAVAGPRGCRLYIEPSGDVPLVWIEVDILGGAAADPVGKEGLANHAAHLARLGAGELDRARFDDALDDIGASIEVSTDRDAVCLSAVCLERNLDRLVTLLADVLARPRMDASEHDKLLRETRFSLDEMRDDDSWLAARFFSREYLPGHPYARTAVGTEASLARLELAEVRALHRAQVVPANLVVGIAGAVTEERARAVAERLVADLPEAAPPRAPAVEAAAAPGGRRVVIVDKPERTQSQVLIGHLGPRAGSDEAVPLQLVETVFGGTFTSRLMQEIRVKRGWSYGAGCRLGRARGPSAFRIFLAPAAEVSAEAVGLTMSLFESVAGDGIDTAELEFARRYLTGSLPFHLATAQQRMRIAVRDHSYGLPDDHLRRLPERLEAVSVDDARQAARSWLRPRDALVVVVATAAEIAPRLREACGVEPEIVPYDSY